uniref:Secreted protein n=1 Tax=Angiostrongylus cantonensis TaxID=6313 RepID=A0A0K0D6T7_ANGCA
MKRLFSLLALFVLFIVQTDGQYYGGYPPHGHGFNPYGGYHHPYAGFIPYGGFNPNGGFNPYGGFNAHGGHNPYGGHSSYGGHGSYLGFLSAYNPFRGFNFTNPLTTLGNGLSSWLTNTFGSGYSSSTQSSWQSALTRLAAERLVAAILGKK